MMNKIGRNAPCPCGSGKKHKKCCLGKTTHKTAATRTAKKTARAVPAAVDQGYAHYVKGRSVEALLAWLPAWEEVRARLPARITNSDAADEFLGFAFSLWCCELEDAALNAGVEDPALAPRGALFCGQWLDQFVDDPPEARVNYHRTHAELTLRSGEVEKAERLYEKMVSECSHESWAHIFYADALMNMFGDDDDYHLPFDRAKARFHLDRAGDVARSNYDEEGMIERLEFLASTMEPLVTLSNLAEELAPGYKRFRANEKIEALEAWLRVWERLLEEIPPEVKSTAGLEELFPLNPSLTNWFSDLEAAFIKAIHGDRQYAQRGVRLCRQWLERFSEEAPDERLSVHRALAEFTLRSGDVEKGLELVEEMAEKWPDQPWAHIYCADAFSHLFADPSHHVPFDLDKARRHLKLAGERASDPRDREVVKERLAYLKEAVPVGSRV